MTTTTTITTTLASLPVIQGIVVGGGWGGWDGCSFLSLVLFCLLVLWGTGRGFGGGHHSEKSMLPLETPSWFAPIGGTIMEVNSSLQIQVYLECKQKTIYICGWRWAQITTASVVLCKRPFKPVH